MVNVNYRVGKGHNMNLSSSKKSYKSIMIDHLPSSMHKKDLVSPLGIKSPK